VGSGTTRVSVATGGRQGNGDSGSPALSGDGSTVAFASNASNLVPGDTNATWDVFVRNVKAGTTRRVSLGVGGSEGNDQSGVFGPPSISGDGRLVAFESGASNLVASDTNQVTDIFVRDLVSGSTRRVSVSTRGGQGNNFSDEPAISADGRYVAFESAASNLVPGDTNGVKDIFVRDLARDTTRRVSLSGKGLQGNDYSDVPAISANGRYVAFESAASNLVPGDTNGDTDVFVRDLVAGTTKRISLSTGGQQGNDNSSVYGSPSISADGRIVAFESEATNLVAGDTNHALDVFVHDVSTGKTVRVSVTTSGAQAGNGYSTVSGAPVLSADGRYVAFFSAATNLVAQDTNHVTDVFVHGLTSGTTRRVSVTSSGAQANAYSDEPAISGDGRVIAFESLAGNLVPGDTNRHDDVFIRPLG
jgi:Tol biopolymer transport system component